MAGLHYTSVTDAGITPINLTDYRINQAHLNEDQACNLLSLSHDSLTFWETKTDKLPALLYNHYLSVLHKAAQLYKTDPTNPIFTLNNEDLKPLDRVFSYQACTEQFVEQLIEAGVDFPDEFWPYEFVPAQPVLFKEQIRYDSTGKEPYPGFGQAYENHQYVIQQAIHQANAHDLGRDYMSLDRTDETLSNPRYTHDEDGNPVYYDDEPLVVTDINDEIVGVDTPQQSDNTTE